MKVRTFFRKALKKLRGGRVTLYPKGPSKGRVLLSYKTEPFIDFEEKEHIHTNIWECREIANLFLKKGYTVDVIDWFNHKFIPTRKYQYFIDLEFNLKRLSPLVNKDCIKVLHATTSHWLFNNEAEHERLLALEKRKGILLKPRRLVAANNNIEDAEFATLIGNDITESTYAFANKKMYQIPISTTHQYPFPDDRNINKVKKTFVWLGGVGLVHKGLDLVLEAFSQLPEYQLYVCGDVAREKDFEKLYWHELYDTANIKVLGKVDVGGEIFRKITHDSIGLVYPSCAEGQAGSVITCMHSGLIPVVSAHSGVNLGDFGVLIEKGTVEGLIASVQTVALMPEFELRRRSRQAWQYARENHTRARFSEEYAKFVTMLESRKGN